MENEIKDIIEMLELVKEELEDDDESVTATLDLEDLKALKNLYELYKQVIEERDGIYNDYQDLGKESLKLQEELEQEKEKNKELEKHYEHEQEYINAEIFSAKQMHIIDEDYISKDKIMQIINECLDKKPNVITGKEEYCFNVNDNSFLAHKIVELLEEK